MRQASGWQRACRAAGQLGRFSLLLPRDATGRYWEVDALRGIAILMMITYHLFYDLEMFGYYQPSVRSGLWLVSARLTASLFMLLMGISLVLGRARTGLSANTRRVFARYLTRGLTLIGWGVVVTLITWLYMDRVVVTFGILHMLGSATILAYPLLRLRWLSLAIGSAVIGLGVFLGQSLLLHRSHAVLRVLGLQSPSPFEIDYFPLLPWFGVVLLGLFAGQSLYPNGKPRLRLAPLGHRLGVRQLTWLGRHSLLVYLIHQPVLIASLTLVSAVVE